MESVLAYDLAIIGGMVVDPVDGLSPLNIGIKEDRIYAILPEMINAKKTINAEGKYVCPGFIDIHMHTYPFGQTGFLETLEAMALMGVTTVLDGHCGLGNADFARSKATYLQDPAPVNYSALIGHLSLRMLVGSCDLFSPATGQELVAMVEILEEALETGAPGLSFSLEYMPGTSLEEQLILCRKVAEYEGRIVCSHYRFDADRFPEAIEEMIIVARESGVRYQVSHIGSGAAFGQMAQALKMLDGARDAGVDIMADLYPYNSFMTAAGTTCFEPGCLERWNAAYSDLYIADGSFKGQSATPDILAFVRANEPQVMIMASVMNEEEIKMAVRHPLVMIASDGMIFEGQGHPRSSGTFPRFLGCYVREEGLLGWPEAIEKITAKPAKQLGLTGRGRLKEGYLADITVLDPNLIIDRSTIAEPVRPPLGIESVIVGGAEVVKEGKLTGQNSGRFLQFS